MKTRCVYCKELIGEFDQFAVCKECWKLHMDKLFENLKELYPEFSFPKYPED